MPSRVHQPPLQARSASSARGTDADQGRHAPFDRTLGGPQSRSWSFTPPWYGPPACGHPMRPVPDGTGERPSRVAETSARAPPIADAIDYGE